MKSDPNAPFIIMVLILIVLSLLREWRQSRRLKKLETRIAALEAASEKR